MMPVTGRSICLLALLGSATVTAHPNFLRQCWAKVGRPTMAIFLLISRVLENPYRFTVILCGLRPHAGGIQCHGTEQRGRERRMYARGTQRLVGIRSRYVLTPD